MRHSAGWTLFWQGTVEMEAFLDTEEERLQCTLAPGFLLAVPESWQYLP